jgi:predicted phosphodiesterase
MKLRHLIYCCLLTFIVQTAVAQSAGMMPHEQKKEIVFTSDTQGPIWLETLWLKPNKNRQATTQIFKNLLLQSPASVFILGDVVSKGFSERQWRLMDGNLRQLRSRGVKVNAVMGNHDVLWFAKRGQKKFQSRFPNHVKTGYVEVTDSVAVVLLNSNYNILSPEEDSTQVAWYKNTLDKLDKDSSIIFIITGCHHSPYTNSRFTGYSKEVQEKFVPWYLRSLKSRLFLSGHTHSFEHFKKEGKDFLVIGGGGGLHENVKAGNCKLPDLQSNYKPMFHYLTVRRQHDTLQLSSVRLQEDFSSFEEVVRVDIKKNTPTENLGEHQGATATIFANAATK